MTNSASFPMTFRRGRQLVSLLVGAVAASLLFAGTASASCVMTPAICKAICGSPCCDNTNLTTPADPDALSKIPFKTLNAELVRSKKGTKFRRMLSSEVARRG